MMKLFAATVALLILCGDSFGATNLTLRIKRAGAPEAAPTPEGMAFMMDRDSTPVTTYRIDNVKSVASQKDTPFNWYRGSWQNPFYLAEYSGLLEIPEEGDYEFRLYCREPHYLWLNGRLLINEESFRHTAVITNGIIPWSDSGRIGLSKGPAEFRLITMCRQNISLSLQWKTPASDGYFTEVMPENWLARPAASTVALPPAYSFSSIRGAFVYSADTDGNILQPAYNQDATAFKEYRLNAKVTGIPSICDINDTVSPEIQGNCDAPDSVPIRFEAEVVSRTSGCLVTNSYYSVIAFDRGWGRLRTSSYIVRDLVAINWKATHLGTVIESGSVEFLKRPYGVVPDSISGTSLMYGNREIVPVTRTTLNADRPQKRYQRLTMRTAMGNLAVIDGFITSTTQGGLEVGVLFDAVLTNSLPLKSYSRITQHDLNPNHQVPFSGRNLLQLLTAGKVKSGSTVVIAPEIRGEYFGEGLADFRKRLSALTAFLKDAAQCRIIMLTPPDGIPGAGYSTETTRAYAAAIRLVADIENLEVVDLYTLAGTMKHKCAGAASRRLCQECAFIAAERIRGIISK